MTEQLWLVSRTTQGKSVDLNKITNVLINIDDGDDDLTKLQGTVDALNAKHPRPAGSPAIYPAGYFDTVIRITDLSGTTDENLRTDQDFIAYSAELFSELSIQI